MPFHRDRYPDDWEAISGRVRQDAKDKCEFCGAPNHTQIVRSSVDAARYILWNGALGGYTEPNGRPIRMSEIPSEFDASPLVGVVLTVAHLDHDTTNNVRSNLRALCQRCHLSWDAKHHAKNAAITRRRKIVEGGPRDLGI